MLLRTVITSEPYLLVDLYRTIRFCNKVFGNKENQREYKRKLVDFIQKMIDYSNELI